MSETATVPLKKPRLSPPQLRTFTKIPIFIVDYHNEVLDFIYRSLATRYLLFQGNSLVHFDSHPDMVISRQMKSSTVFKKDELLSELSIENWIMPTCFAGHFKKLIWAKNSWCDQIPEGNHEFLIGDVNDQIHVSLAVDYFVSEGNYCEPEKLQNTKHVTLEVINTDKKSECRTLNENDTIVLDIDLDYFSVSNPFLSLYEKADTYNRVQKIFSYIEEGDPSDLVQKRRNQLDDLDGIFKHLQNNRTMDDFKNTKLPNDKYEQINELVETVMNSYKDSEIDWMLIYDAGCTSDHNGLPHHVSTEEQLNKYFNDFKDFLIKLPKSPVIVTMARSAEDGYCPQEQVDMIQCRILEILYEIYGDKINQTPILAYKGEDWNIMKL